MTLIYLPQSFHHHPSLPIQTVITRMSSEQTARLRILQITDVYTLQNFPRLKTLIAEKRAEVEAEGGRCISVLTGDFLAPYLLSSFDKVSAA